MSKIRRGILNCYRLFELPRLVALSSDVQNSTALYDKTPMFFTNSLSLRFQFLIKDHMLFDNICMKHNLAETGNNIQIKFYSLVLKNEKSFALYNDCILPGCRYKPFYKPGILFKNNAALVALA